ncbi:calcium-binding protein [Cupriavidus campinensis]
MNPRHMFPAGLALAACLACGPAAAQQPAVPAPAAAPASASATPASAPAQRPANAKEAKAKFAEKFKAADTDHDGKLTRDEAQAGMPEVYKQFDQIDVKKAGAVTQRQIGAYFAAKAKQRKAAQDPGSLN